MSSLLRPALSLLGLFTLLTGLVYPWAVTQVSQLVFPARAQGSLVRSGERVIGSALIGQPFRSPGYFWGRPSVTARHPYDGAASAASNLGPTNPALVRAVAARVAELRRAHPGNTEPVPVDLVTGSASGLDPHVTPAAALFQVERVAQARGWPVGQVRDLVRAHVEQPTFGLFGAPRVNVLLLNLALDAAQGVRP